MGGRRKFCTLSALTTDLKGSWYELCCTSSVCVLLLMLTGLPCPQVFVNDVMEFDLVPSQASLSAWPTGNLGLYYESNLGVTFTHVRTSLFIREQFPLHNATGVASRYSELCSSLLPSI